MNLMYIQSLVITNCRNSEIIFFQRCTYVYYTLNSINTSLIFCRSKIKFEISGSMDGSNGSEIKT